VKPENSRQVRHVHDLLEALVVAKLRHHALVGEDDAIDTHSAFARNPPAYASIC
jgi:hypothetical protein